MTVPYMKSIADANTSKFIKLMFRWRGSVWKSLYVEVCCYMLCYYTIHFINHTIIAPNMSTAIFQATVHHFDELVQITFTTVTFAMGFYVTQIYNRWWAVFMMIPWPDSFAFEILAYARDRPFSKHKKEDDNARKTMVRHLCLSFVLVFRDISERVKTRFPQLEHLVGSLLTENEKDVLEGEDEIRERMYWIPIEWISNLLKRSYNAHQIDDIHYSRLIASLLDFRERLHNVLQYDTVNLPLIYTQVVHLMTYTYFAIQLIASQKTYSSQKYWFEVLPFPGYILFEFVFLVGWLKAAEVMINPFGNDDDDFDIDIIIERNLVVCYSAVGELFEKSPHLVDMDYRVEPSKSEIQLNFVSKQKNVQLLPSAVAIEVPAAEQRQVTLFHDDVEKQVKVVPKENPALEKKSSTSETPPPPTPPHLQIDGSKKEGRTSRQLVAKPKNSKRASLSLDKKTQSTEKKTKSTDKATFASRVPTPHASQIEYLEGSKKGTKEPAIAEKLAEELKKLEEKRQMEELKEGVMKKRNKLEQKEMADVEKSRSKGRSTLKTPAPSKQASLEGPPPISSNMGKLLSLQSTPQSVFSVQNTPKSVSVTQHTEETKKKNGSNSKM